MWRLVISIGCLRGLSATTAMIVDDLTVTTPANQMAHASRANEGTACCNALRRDWHEASLERMHSVAVGGIGDIACDPTSLIEPRRPRTRKAILPSQRPDLLR